MRNKTSLAAFALVCLGGFGLAGCNYSLRQDMANQPREESTFAIALLCGRSVGTPDRREHGDARLVGGRCTGRAEGFECVSSCR